MGERLGMVAVALGSVVGVGIVVGLVADWFSHPDLEWVPTEASAPVSPVSPAATD